jgi:ribosome maturation factor RimP
MSEQADRLAALVAPALDALGLTLYDIEVAGSGRARTLRVLVDREGGVDLDTITATTEALGPILDRDPLVESMLRGSYVLEVSSPGLERPLRTPTHFRGAVGSEISLKSRTPDGSTKRRRATLVAADDDGIEVDVDGGRERVRYAEVVQARTVFEWEAAPKPGRPRKAGESTPTVSASS